MAKCEICGKGVTFGIKVSQTTDPTNPPVEGDAMTGDGEIA